MKSLSKNLFHLALQKHKMLPNIFLIIHLDSSENILLHLKLLKVTFRQDTVVCFKSVIP